MLNRGSKPVYGFLILILLVAFFLRVCVLNDAAVKNDEFRQYERNLSGMSLWQIPVGERRIGAHVLALLWAKSALHLLGDKPFSLRWPAACMSLLSVVLIFKIATWLFGKRVGLASAFLLAISPLAVYYAYDFRGYSGSILYVLLAYGLCIRGVQNDSRWYWFAVALSMGAAVYNHLYAALAWPGLVLMVFLYYRQKRKEMFPWPRVILLTAASLAGMLVAVVGALVPAVIRLLLEIFNGSRAGTGDVYIPQSPNQPATLLSTISWFSGVSLDGMNAHPMALYLLIALAGLAVLLAGLSRRYTGVVILLGWLLLPWVTYHAGHLVMPTLLAREKYFVFALPAFLMLVALADQEIGCFLGRCLPVKHTGQWLVSSSILLAITVLWVPALHEMYVRETRGNWPAVASYLAPRLERDAVVLCESFDHNWGVNYAEESKMCRLNLTYWVKAKNASLIYPVLSLGEASDYHSVASNLHAASRLGRVWLVVFDVPPGVEFESSSKRTPREWDRFGRTILLPPPDGATIIESMMSHLEYLSSLPHPAETIFDYHTSLAQLASIQGLTDRAQREWQAAKALCPDVPGSATLLEAARETLDYPPLLKTPASPMEFQLGNEIRFDGFTLHPGQVASPSDSVQLTLFWHALKRPTADYTVFIHVYDEEGNLALQDDFLPVPHTEDWWPNDSAWQERLFRLPADMHPGEYRVHTGMYLLSTLERLPVVGEPASDDSVFLFTLRIE